MAFVDTQQEFSYFLLTSAPFFLSSESQHDGFVETEHYFDMNLLQVKEFIKTTDPAFNAFSINILQQSEEAEQEFIVSLREYTPVETYSRAIYNMLQDDGTIFGAIPSVHTEYEVMILFDGDDITDKVSTCSISYSKDNFTGEINLTFADPSMYRRLNCTNIKENYRRERFEVRTRIKGASTWHVQGRFFLESRDTSLSHDGGLIPQAWGRTKTAKLSTPYARGISKAWVDLARLYYAKEIALEILADYPDIELVWNVMNYEIWPGRFDLDNVTPIDAIQQLASPLGAIVSTNKAGQLVVRYKWENI